LQRFDRCGILEAASGELLAPGAKTIRLRLKQPFPRLPTAPGRIATMRFNQLVRPFKAHVGTDRQADFLSEKPLGRAEDDPAIRQRAADRAKGWVLMAHSGHEPRTELPRAKARAAGHEPAGIAKIGRTEEIQR
jgi:hypothetical protein